MTLLLKYASYIVICIIIIGAILFMLAGRLDYWPGWVLLVVFMAAMSAIITYVVLFDPELLKERRRKAPNVKRWDKTILNVYLVILVIMLCGAVLDGGRFHLSDVPLSLQIGSIIFIMVAISIIFWVFRINTYLSSRVRIQDDRGHRVITTGPYHFIRHPMYAALLVFFPSIPLLLDSFWALIPAGVIDGLYVLRTHLEDKTLQKELDGYYEYSKNTKYRLLPGIW